VFTVKVPAVFKLVSTVLSVQAEINSPEMPAKKNKGNVSDFFVHIKISFSL